MSDVSISLFDFGLSLYRSLVKENGQQNIFFSPLSIYTALLMVYTGSDNKTARQMREVMKTSFLPKDEEMLKWVEQIWTSFEKKSSVQLELANKLWLQNGYQIKTDYQNVLTNYFKVSVELENFTTNANEARLKMNKWVEQKTNEKIKDLLSEGSISSLTRLVLGNAIYFKGNWKSQFRNALTRKREFCVNKNKKKMVDMMFQESNQKFVVDNDLDAKIISLPYENSSLSMVVVLPNDIEGIGKLELQFDFAQMGQVIATMRSVKVEVFLPKFKMELPLNLKDQLMKLGMADLFDAGACDLSGISDSNDLFVSDAVHKAFIEVNEEGTEAAAATAMVMNLRCAMPRVEKNVFKADHPFMYFIYDSLTKSVLFMGKVYEI